PSGERLECLLVQPLLRQHFGCACGVPGIQPCEHHSHPVYPIFVSAPFRDATASAFRSSNVPWTSVLVPLTATCMPLISSVAPLLTSILVPPLTVTLCEPSRVIFMPLMRIVPSFFMTSSEEPVFSVIWSPASST